AAHRAHFVAHRAHLATHRAYLVTDRAHLAAHRDDLTLDRVDRAAQGLEVLARLGIHVADFICASACRASVDESIHISPTRLLHTSRARQVEAMVKIRVILTILIMIGFPAPAWAQGLC